MNYYGIYVSQPFEEEGLQVCLKTSNVVFVGESSAVGKAILEEHFPEHAPWAVIGGGQTHAPVTPWDEITFTTEDAAIYWPPPGSEGLTE